MTSDVSAPALPGRPGDSPLKMRLETLLEEADQMDSPTVMVTDLRDALATQPDGGEGRVLEGLRLIAESAGGGCEHSTSGIGSCARNGRTADSVYGCDRMCPPCVAHLVLNSEPIPRGIGSEAEAQARSR